MYRSRRSRAVVRQSSLERTLRERSEAIYRLMVLRVEKQGLIVPFTQTEFKTWLLVAVFRGSAENAVQCSYCTGWLNASTFVIDHEVPLRLGGLTTLDNLVVACADCNTLKGALSPEGFRRLLDFARLHLHAQDANEMFGRMKNGGAYIRMQYLMHKGAKKGPQKLTESIEPVGLECYSDASN